MLKFCRQLIAMSDILKPQQPVAFTPGQTYVYEYSGRLLTGVPQLADQYSGFEIIADLILQPLNNNVIAMMVCVSPVDNISKTCLQN